MVMFGVVIAQEAAPAGTANQKTYDGTFSDTSKRKGGLTCQMTQAQGDKWTLKFTGKNEGQGPNKPYEYTFELAGKTEGNVLTLSGKPDLPKQGSYEVAVTVSNQAAEGKFKKADGSNSGSFSLKQKQAAP
jgi:hypothetical protein